MATQPDDDEPLELTEEMEVPAKTGDEANAGEEEGDDEQERVTFADEEGDEPVEENSVIRQMRAELKEERRRRLEAEQKSAPAKIEIGDKPTMEGCGFDEDVFETELDAWKERKAAAERQETSQAEENRKINEVWQADVAAFEQGKATLTFEDRDEAIETATASLDLVQQAVIVKAANDPALFLYALSKSPAKLAELGKIKDPVKMAAAVARMEGAVKVVKGRKAPDPDRPERGSASMPGGPDKQLEKLTKDADRTGDRTALIAYKKGQKAKAA